MRTKKTVTLTAYRKGEEIKIFNVTSWTKKWKRQVKRKMEKEHGIDKWAEIIISEEIK